MSKHIFTIFLIALCCTIGAAQNNIDKTAGVNYTSGKPTYNPSQKTGSEYAIDTTNGRFYQLHRTSSTSGTWKLLGQGIDTIGTSVRPTYAPTRNMSWFVINAVDSLFRYSGAGVLWDCLNCPAASGGSGTVTSVAATAPAAGFTISGSPITTAGTFVFTLANDLAALEALTGTGIPARTAADTWALRTITAGTGISVVDGAGVSGNPTITNTGDLSNTNEIQTLNNTFAATTHTTTLSNAGGSLQLVEGANITLTTTGTGLDGIVTIAATSVGTDLTFTGAASPYTLNSSTGTDVTFTAGAGITITRLVNDLAFVAVDPSVTNEIQTYTHTGLTSYTNTLSIGGGAFTLTAAGILTLSHTAGTVTLTATEAQIANNGLSDNEAGGGIFRLGNRFMNASDGLFSFDRKVNINAFKLFIGDNTDSTLLHIDGVNDRVGIGTTAPGRKLTVNGEVEIKDLVTTNPTLIVGVDINGVLSEITLGTNLSFAGTTLNATGGGTSYQTWRDDGVNATQRPNANFVSTATVAMTLTDDAANTETEVTANVIDNSITNAKIRQGIARSVMGVTGNATANINDIQGTADQVLRVTTAGTALSFGQVANGGLMDAAVTYAKIQNAVGNNILLGNNNGAGTPYEELTVASIYTLLGITGVSPRFAIWTGANTLTSNAAYTHDIANGRMTITPTAAGLGAGLAGLNISTAALVGSMEFLQMRGSISGNLLAGQFNTNNTNVAAHSFYTVSSGGTAGGDAFIQFQIAGAGGSTSSLGADNAGAGDPIRLTPNVTTPGGTANVGMTWTLDATTLVGINKDAPLYELDITGRTRASKGFMGKFAQWLAANIVFGTGAGTAPVLNSIGGTDNALYISFTTGTAPVNNAVIFTGTYPNSWASNAFVIFSADNTNNSATDITKFRTGNRLATAFDFVANGTLSASTNYQFCFMIYSM